ncbi:AraC family transcriptional regulator [Labrenzia sp. 011]|nr:AraC family transcriptional regulator [Labrenzia sp. 011]
MHAARLFLRRSPAMTFESRETIPTLTLSSMTLFRLLQSSPDETSSLVPLLCDGYLIEVHMRPLNQHRLWRDHRLVSEGHLPEGAVSIRDTGAGWRAQYPEGLDAAVFHIPHARVRDFAIAAGRLEFTSLHQVQGIHDPSIHGLAQALMPVLAHRGSASRLFLDQMGCALLAHLTQRYGGLTYPSARRGGLAPWQEERATEFLAAHMTCEIHLEELAAACDLSRSYFNKAFKISFGKSPMRWLAEYRVAKARDLLNTGMPISEIAVACGFADQSHLTRVFADIMGESPGVWRKARQNVSPPRRTVPSEFGRQAAT